MLHHRLVISATIRTKFHATYDADLSSKNGLQYINNSVISLLITFLLKLAYKITNDITWLSLEQNALTRSGGADRCQKWFGC